MVPLITIGVCIKNNEATITEAINSIIDQDYPNKFMEIIVVDGCSQDKTLSIIKKLLLKKAVNVKFFSENKGLGFARQIVVNNALGKYIVWVDGDILLSPSYITEQVNFMEQNSNFAIAVGSYGLMPNDNWVSLLESIGYVVESLKLRGKETSNLLGTKGSIFRVSAIKSVGSFDVTLKGAQEDIDLAYELKRNGWKFFISNAMLYEIQRKKWSDLWKRHFWYGYGLHCLQHKHKERNMFMEKSNDRIIISSIAYKITNRKVVFLLPINFLFRKIALLFGFLMSHLNGYGHNH